MASSDSTTSSGSTMDEKDEGERKQSNVVREIEIINQLLDNAKNVIREKFVQENKIMMDEFKNELAKEIQKQKDYVMNMASYTKETSFDIIEIYSSHYISNRMLEEPLSNLEIEELKQKWRQQKAIEVEATIKRLALMQEEIQMKVARILTLLNDKSS